MILSGCCTIGISAILNGTDCHLVRTSTTALANVVYLFGEDERCLPAKDTLTVTPGFLGAYPNVFFRVDAKQLSAFVSAVESLDSDEAYRDLMDRFAVPPISP